MDRKRGGKAHGGAEVLAALGADLRDAVRAGLGAGRFAGRRADALARRRVLSSLPPTVANN